MSNDKAKFSEPFEHHVTSSQPRTVLSHEQPQYQQGVPEYTSLDTSMGYSGHHHHHQVHHQLYGSHQQSPLMMDMHPNSTLSAPSPPDSASPVSMSSSPIPPQLATMTTERTQDSMSHNSLDLQGDCSNNYTMANMTHQAHFQQLALQGPSLRFTEQPTNRIRYRYKSEKGSHGGLTGENSTPNKKTYPTIKLDNYRPTGQVMAKASLVTHEPVPRPHVHKLMGRYCNDEGFCIIPMGENGTAVFQNLGILFSGKKEVPDILYQRKLDDQRIMRDIHNALQLSESENQRLREEAERDAKHINLNCVRIAFEAFDCGQNANVAICQPVISRPVANQKSPDSGELKINRTSKDESSCTGNELIFLFCEKVSKKDIKIRFFETDNAGNQLWEDFAIFNENDVHHQVGIAFKTPPYRDQNLEEYVQVYMQLLRTKDLEVSEPRPFTYCPRDYITYKPVILSSKRKKIDHTSGSVDSFGSLSDSMVYYDHGN
ncbi:Nuclear factor NF-kappa-B -like protein [Halotydeus destructor]|nr:Nuclear factor NF-kappa-B -like protein [Halotydeus destructor]